MSGENASSSEYPLDEWIASVRECKFLPEEDMKKLCDLVKSYLLEESNVQPVSSPVTICGDIHGQFFDLLELFRTGTELPETNYIFMGDFVDRGYHSLETFTYLLLLRLGGQTRSPSLEETTRADRSRKFTVFMTRSSRSMEIPMLGSIAAPSSII